MVRADQEFEDEHAERVDVLLGARLLIPAGNLQGFEFEVVVAELVSSVSYVPRLFSSRLVADIDLACSEPTVERIDVVQHLVWRHLVMLVTAQGVG